MFYKARGKLKSPGGGGRGAGLEPLFQTPPPPWRGGSKGRRPMVPLFVYPPFPVPTG